MAFRFRGAADELTNSEIQIQKDAMEKRRLSQATIQSDSTFSIFPGCDRWLAVWQGDAIFLNDKKLAPLEPFRFSGDENSFCRISGKPVRDLGLIFDRDRVNAEMTLVEGLVNLPPSDVHYIFDVISGYTLKLDHVVEMMLRQSLLVSIWWRYRITTKWRLFFL